jgi:hypothetical protein
VRVRIRQGRNRVHNQEVRGKNIMVYMDDGMIYFECHGMSLYDHYLACRGILATLRRNEICLSSKKLSM